MKKTKNLIMAAIVLVMGIFLIFVAPGLLDTTTYQLIFKMSKQATQMTAGPLSRLYITAIYSGVEMFVGFALVVLAFMFYYEKKWAWPMSMVLLSIPAMVNGYMGLGWLENLKMFPPCYITFFLSLVAFWVMILLKDGTKKSKAIVFGIFTLIGMIGAQAFMLFPHALRVILKNPATVLTDGSVAVLRRSGTLMFLSFIFSGLSILLLAKRKEAGWYTSIVTGLMMTIGAFTAHYARPLVASLVPADSLEASIFTSTYWMAGAQGVLLIILMIVLKILCPDTLVDEVEDAESPF